MADGRNLSARRDLDRELVGKIAMDIGKEAVSHLRTMFPDAYARLPQGGLSLRNHIHNQIMAALDTVDADAIEARLRERAARRRATHMKFETLRRARP